MSGVSVFRSFALVALLSACSGGMTGVVRGSGQPVVFTYEQGMSSDSLTADVDGEVFKGKAVMRGNTAFVGTQFGASGGMGTVLGSTTTGDFVAMLIGNKGSTMSCQLQYADSSGFTSMGGVGICRHSDGRMIDVMW